MKKINITPEEALRVMKYAKAPAVENALDIAENYFTRYKISKAKTEKDQKVVFNALLLTLYNAGRIDGIRSERARRKAVQA